MDNLLIYLTNIFTLFRSLRSIIYSLWLAITIPISILLILVIIFIAIGAAQHYFLTSTDIDEETKELVILRLRQYFDWYTSTSIRTSTFPSSSSAFALATFTNIPFNTSSIATTETNINHAPPSWLPSSLRQEIDTNNTSWLSNNNLPNENKKISPPLSSSSTTSSSTPLSSRTTINNQPTTLVSRITTNLQYIYNHFHIPYIFYIILSIIIIIGLYTNYKSKIWNIIIQYYSNYISDSPTVPSSTSSHATRPSIPSKDSNVASYWYSLMNYLYATTNSSSESSMMTIIVEKLLSLKIEVYLLLGLLILWFILSYRNHHYSPQQRKVSKLSLSNNNSNSNNSSTNISNIDNMKPTSTVLSDSIDENHKDTDYITHKLNTSIVSAIQNELPPRRLSITSYPLSTTKNENPSLSDNKSNIIIPPQQPLIDYSQYVDIDSSPSSLSTNVIGSSVSPVTNRGNISQPSISSNSVSVNNNNATSPTTTHYSHFRLNKNNINSSSIIDGSPESFISYGNKSRISLGGF